MISWGWSRLGKVGIHLLKFNLHGSRNRERLFARRGPGWITAVEIYVHRWRRSTVGTFIRPIAPQFRTFLQDVSTFSRILLNSTRSVLSSDFNVKPDLWEGEEFNWVRKSVSQKLVNSRKPKIRRICDTIWQMWGRVAKTKSHFVD